MVHNKKHRQILGFMLVIILLIQTICSISIKNVLAASRDKSFSLTQAQNLALVNSSEYLKVKNQITLQKVKYKEAVKSIKLKQKNMSTFRWTPLLSFKFPETPDMAEAYEFTYKPLQIETEITSLRHKLKDTKYEVMEKVSLQYVTVYTSQEKINFKEDTLEAAKKDLERNEALYKLGQATKADLDKMRSNIKTLESDLSLLMRSFETAKKDLSDLVKIDVTTGFTFKSPLVTAELPRENLEALIQYTLSNSQAYFDAKLDSKAALTSLTTYESIMQNKYGSRMNYIQTYVNQAKAGKTVDYEAFKTKYDEMLTAMDAPWNGKKRILFFKIPKEWFKGEKDGTRYIDDEPYALYTASMEYSEALNNEENTKKEVTKTVETNFESIVTAKNAYESLEETVDGLKTELDRLLEQNKLGEAEYEEVKDKQEEYQTSQMDTLDALSSYSNLLYSFDRLTCGGVTKLLQGESLTTDEGTGGDSIVEKEIAEGAYYYIQTKVEDNLFVLGVRIPEGFEPEVSDFELWYNGVLIGERTKIDKQLVHLTLVYGEADSVIIRLYNGEDFVSDCEIDPSVPTDKLDITDSYVVDKTEEKEVGTYQVTSTDIGTMELSFIVNKEEGIGYYTVTSQAGKSIYSEDPIPIDRKFTYLSLLAEDLSSLPIKFYDENKKYLYTGTLDEKKANIIVNTKE